MNTLDAAYNGIPLINGEEYSWGNIKTCINGIVVTGITAIAYGDKQDMQNNYGAGRHPVSRSYGRITPSAKITLYMSEVVAISRTSPTGRMQDIAPFDIEVAYLPPNGIIVIDKIRNCQFTENKRDWKEGDMNQQVELELLPGSVEYGKPDGV
ncbi:MULTISPECIES: hypothetical protein [Muribaculaceae]|jgi:hypothetical protein|uniref:hypothetical protein n=2 Tax=Bacteroidales TaxID=171549 RepID=UPI0010A4BFBB|nr:MULTISPECIES: hypothetical protein [Muribaculaceae]QCD40277.1 hypothetical protein E7745_12510 [Duncaniella sp. C9]QCP71379.1 hypothetical protein FDZ78_01755 [Duncaniella sp. B8]QCP73667.1 hypothetical protein FDZ78_14470 [Duncaniella sp. B8]GFI34958.1 hypothetical protein IMSAGC014_01465 [Bacteroidaceae bacterium]